MNVSLWPGDTGCDTKFDNLRRKLFNERTTFVVMLWDFLHASIVVAVLHILRNINVVLYYYARRERYFKLQYIRHVKTMFFFLFPCTHTHNNNNNIIMLYKPNRKYISPNCLRLLFTIASATHFV